MILKSFCATKEELRALEAAAEAEPHLGDPGDAQVLAAKAAAENRRLERELRSLKDLASRQRGEAFLSRRGEDGQVEWLHELKQQLKGSRHEVGERRGDFLCRS